MTKVPWTLGKTAFDEGICYFNTARLYALGESEGVLGQFLSHPHNEAVLNPLEKAHTPIANFYEIALKK